MTDWQHEHEILAAAHQDLGTAHDQAITVLKETVPVLKLAQEKEHIYRCGAGGCTDACESMRAVLKDIGRLAP